MIPSSKPEFDVPSAPAQIDDDEYAALFPGSAQRAPKSLDAAAEAKPKMTAWQRWEMNSINDVKPAAAPKRVVPTKPAPPILNDIELAKLRQQAQLDGHAKGEKIGHAEGYAAGYAQGQAKAQTDAAELATQQATQLLELMQSLPTALRLAEREVADDLLALALDIAHQVVGQALNLEPKLILSAVTSLLQAEPALNGTPQLLLHPDDAALVHEHLKEEIQHAGWRIRTDMHIQRGGCRVTSTSGEHDASMPTRWSRVAAALPCAMPSETMAGHD
ncbi:Flagellar assembly protein FliH [Polaromonas vacuolata]|uniref:Flagellar assembly protein FliH n=1 Tax=Polaromonas vacuolata TaxID=37448 RepID=A0A6H2H5N0_9BURK|nr:flagellar assembly protein FliH [Polaromonas vacuolata]QJC55159.1 Flagellar assembly protein FliH [Polaromonas vacuolata]